MDVEIKSFIKVWSIALVSTYSWVPLATDCPFGPIASCFHNIPSIRLNARVTHLLPHSCESQMGGDVLLYRTRNVHGCWVRAQEEWWLKGGDCTELFRRQWPKVFGWGQAFGCFFHNYWGMVCMTRPLESTQLWFKSCQAYYIFVNLLKVIITFK